MASEQQNNARVPVSIVFGGRDGTRYVRMYGRPAADVTQVLWMDVESGFERAIHPRPWSHRGCETARGGHGTKCLPRKLTNRSGRYT